jgi:hypothetical protein
MDEEYKVSTPVISGDSVFDVSEIPRSGYEGPIDNEFVISYDFEDSTSKTSGVITYRFSSKLLHRWFDRESMYEEEIERELRLTCFNLLGIFLSRASVKGNRLTVLFHNDGGFKTDDDKILVKGEETLRTTEQYLLFGGRLTNTEIRKQIIQASYASWQTNFHTFISNEDLLKKIPVDERDLDRNIDYLAKKGLITVDYLSGGRARIQITTSGIDTFEDPERFDTSFALKREQQVVITGDQINTTIVGGNNTVVIKSQIQNAFKQIRQELDENSLLNDEALVKEVDELDAALCDKDPDHGKIKKTLTRIQKLSEQAYKIITCNPLLVEIIGQILASRLD